jgi:hypothetical protein
MSKFEMGQLVATPAALEVLEESRQTPIDLLRRHCRGDWGDLSQSDKQSNEEALEHGSRIFSAYILKTGVKLWVITEAQDDSGVRASTCILLPSEY